MITIVLIELYKRELEKLKLEILSYESDELLWKQFEGTVPAGNICLYLTGNLQHYIGNIVGDSGYIRNKEAEMKARNLSRERLTEEIDATRNTVVNTLEEVSKTDLQKIFPTNEFEEPVTTEYYLIHLLKNFSFYFGQIKYHHQLVSAIVAS
jgi:hypothetical protein